jgi:predicted GNAT family N-acyltransferase
MPESRRLHGKFLVKVVAWATHRKILDRLREQVFVNEQGVPADIVSDGQDGACSHFLLEEDGYPVGCVRLQPSGKLERMAILMPYRNAGLGTELLNFLLDHAREIGLTPIHLHAQLPALPFYQRAGFDIDGQPFVEAGIEHQGMRMDLPSETEGFISGVSYPKPFDELALKLAESARRELRIYSPQLDQAVFDNDSWGSAISAVSRKAREARVRILINDSEQIVKRGHRLLNLSRRLSSSVTIHKLGTHPEISGDTYVVRDTDGIIYKPEEPERPGFYEPDSRASCKSFIEKFDLLWEKSHPDPELRQLSL